MICMCPLLYHQEDLLQHEFVADANRTAMSELNVLAAQIDIPSTRTGRGREIHIQRCASEIRRRLKSRPADLVVLPELASIEYSREAFAHLDRLAETLDGPSFQLYREIAVRCETTVVYGIARKDGKDFLISQVAVGPNGLLLGHYDKLHIAQFGASMEKDYFRAGKHLLVMDVKGIRVAPIICYDIRIPELCRTLVLKHGVDLILHCGAYYRDESFASWHAFVTARAMENQCFVLSLNRAGAHYGDSMFCPPWVDADRPAEIFHSRDEEFRWLSVSREEITKTRRDYSFLSDRLDDYESLECRFAPVVGDEM